MRPISGECNKQRGCNRALCCCCSTSRRLSVSSSSEEAEFPSISRIAHAMVQERLDQIIKQRQETRRLERSLRKQKSREGTKFIVMVAMEKCSYDPREDFRESVIEMILANRIKKPKDLRSLLNYYVSINSEEYHVIILEVFHEGVQMQEKDLGEYWREATIGEPMPESIQALVSIMHRLPTLSTEGPKSTFHHHLNEHKENKSFIRDFKSGTWQ